MYSLQRKKLSLKVGLYINLFINVSIFIRTLFTAKVVFRKDTPFPIVLSSVSLNIYPIAALCTPFSTHREKDLHCQAQSAQDNHEIGICPESYGHFLLLRNYDWDSQWAGSSNLSAEGTQNHRSHHRSLLPQLFHSTSGKLIPGVMKSYGINREGCSVEGKG